MGIAADLFFSTDTARETLHRRITPTDDQQADQQERWKHLAEFLKSKLKEVTGHSMQTWLQGSYKFKTQIRPWTKDAQFDIDLGLYFEWKGEPEDGEHEPEDLKEMVQSALKEYLEDEENDATSVEDPKERCNRISFEPDFHIDVPCYHLDAGRDARSLATQALGWEDSDPKAIYVWFKDEQEDDALRTKVRRQVRYLKMWAALAFEDGGRPSSILLTVLVAEAAREVDLGLADDELLAALVPIIHDRLRNAYLFDDSEVLNPADQGSDRENLNRLSDEENKDFVAKLETFADVAARATAATDKATAAEIWAEAFEQFFPLPEDNNEEILEKSAARNALVLAFDPQVHVVATPKENAHRSWEGTNSLPPVPKDCSIQFTLQNRPPAGATLRWTVRNRGEEAAMKNDLGHIVGTGLRVKRDSAYNGDHAMDLTVMLGRQVIGRRRIAIKVRGTPIPPRNPKRRRRF